MLESKFNLICPRGHKHFAPNPAAWVGRPCGISTDGSSTCQQNLIILENPTKGKK